MQDSFELFDAEELAILRHREACKRWYNNPKNKFRHSLIRHHKMSPDEYAALLQQQDGKCAVCGCLPGDTRLEVDHYHPAYDLYGKGPWGWRGLLCHSCNIDVAYVESGDVTPSESIATYLERYNASFLALTGVAS